MQTCFSGGRSMRSAWNPSEELTDRCFILANGLKLSSSLPQAHTFVHTRTHARTSEEPPTVLPWELLCTGVDLEILD